MLRQLTQEVEDSSISLYAFLPILVVDPAFDIVTTATIDLVSCSAYEENGELRALIELRNLFQDRALANPGAVFGGLVTMGEAKFAAYLDRIEPQLSDEELDVAAHAHTSFLKPIDVRYWLALARRIAATKGGTSSPRFGSCALALTRARRIASSDRVIEGERDFPCRGKTNPIRIVRETTLQKYEEELAPEPYELEAMEDPPKLFSHVLRVWGYEPKARLEDQFIEPNRSGQGDFKRLRKPPNYGSWSWRPWRDWVIAQLRAGVATPTTSDFAVVAGFGDGSAVSRASP